MCCSRHSSLLARSSSTKAAHDPNSFDTRNECSRHDQHSGPPQEADARRRALLHAEPEPRLLHLVGGGLSLIVYDAVGWQVAVLLLAAFSLLPLPLILGWQEGASTSGLPEPRATLRSALAFFSRSAVRWWCLALIPAYTLGFTMAYSLVRPILVDAGWDEGRIGLVVVIGGSGVGIASGLGAGFVIARVGRRRALIRLGMVQVAAAFGVLPAALGVTPQWLVLAVVALANAAFCAAATIVYTISMDLTRPESAGTDFTLFTTIGTVLMVVAGGLGVAVAGLVGFAPVALVAGALSVLGLLFTAWRIDRALPGDSATAGARVAPGPESRLDACEA